MLKRLFIIIAAAALGGSFLVAPPAQARSASFFSSLGEGQFTVYDRTYEVSGCLEVEAHVAMYAESRDVYWSGRFTARLEGTATTNTAFFYASGTSYETDSFYLCPSIDGAGKWLVTGEITLTDYVNDEERVVSVSTWFRVKKASTRMTITRIRPSQYGLDVTGKVTSFSVNYGTVGVPGEVMIQIRKGRKWVDVGSGYANNRGVFTASLYERYPRSTTFRAVYPGDDATNPSKALKRGY